MVIATQFTCLLMTWWRFSIRNRGTPRLEICSLIVYTVCDSLAVNNRNRCLKSDSFQSEIRNSNYRL